MNPGDRFKIEYELVRPLDNPETIVDYKGESQTIYNMKGELWFARIANTLSTEIIVVTSEIPELLCQP